MIRRNAALVGVMLGAAIAGLVLGEVGAFRSHPFITVPAFMALCGLAGALAEKIDRDRRGG